MAATMPSRRSTFSASLDHAERTRLAARIGQHTAFAERVADWEDWFGGLNGAFAEVAPPAYMQARIAAGLFADGAERGTWSGVWQSVAFWRSLSAAALAGLAALAFFMVAPPVPQPAGGLVAVIAPQAGEARFIALYDPASHDLRVTRFAGEKPPGTDHELWLVGSNGKPVSLGLVGGSGAKAPVVPEALRAQIREGATLAVSLEAEGGSVTGAPAEVLGTGKVSLI